MSSNEKQDLVFGDETFVTQEVQGREVRYYPVSVGTLFELRKAAGPIAEALSVLTKKRENQRSDQGSEQHFTGSPYGYPEGELPPGCEDGLIRDKDGEIVRDLRVSVTPISAELAQFRASEEKEAYAKIAAAVMDPGTFRQICKIIVESTRAKQTPEDLSRILTPELARIHLTGVIMANKGLFGDIGDRLGKLLKQTLGGVTEALAEKSKESPTRTGDSFPINSSPSPAPDSTPDG